jgi:hypothetical protein
MELPNDTPEMNLVHRYAEAWNRLDLDAFAPHMADEVTYTSQQVFEELHGREEVEDHLRQKMELIRGSSEDQVRAEIGLCGDQRHETVRVAEAVENRPCVLLQQGASPEPVALVLLEVEEEEVKEIGICTVAPHPSTAHRTGIYPGSTIEE